MTVAIWTLVFFLVAAGEAASSAPDLTGFAAIITAGIGAIAFVISIWRGRANNEAIGEVKEAVKYLDGFEALTARLKEEIDEIREEQREDQRQWAIERKSLEGRAAELQMQLNQQTANNLTLRTEFSAFKDEVKAWLAEDYDEFEKRIARDT